MTRRLYYEDAYCKEFEAAVVRCEERPDGTFGVVLDATAFYPEGGGQDGDTGTMEVIGDAAADAAPAAAGKSDAAPAGGGRIRVLDTHEKDGDCVHYTDAPVAVGARVRGRIDWQQRFDRMQNHSGEHIVSGLIHAAFGYDNVGFHMSRDRMTIDLSGTLTEEEIREIERRANEVVWDDREITATVYPEEEVAALTYRSKKELHGRVRIVRIPGADACACCGTHVRRTGEIGSIRLIAHEHFRGGSRIEMACGRWAYEYMSAIFGQNHEVSVLLSSKMHETAEAVAHLKEQESALSFRMTQLTYARIEAAGEALRGRGNIAVFAPDFDPVPVRKLCEAVKETCGGIALALSGSDETGYMYTAGVKDGDLRAFGKDLNAALSGRGGGRPYFLQGSVKATRAEIEAYLASLAEPIPVTELT